MQFSKYLTGLQKLCSGAYRSIVYACFTLIVFFRSCYCGCSVALCHSAVGWSIVCDCSIS